MPSSRSEGTPEAQLDAFLAKYDPEIAALALEVRSKLRRILPPAIELIYDNYNALVIGFGPSDRTSEAVLSIALYPRWVRLFFLRGADLPDPRGLLEGTGKQVRSLLLSSAATLDEPSVKTLIRRAVERSDPPFDGSARRVVIKSVSAKQRPRRP